MNRKHREKIDLLIKFLKREPRKEDLESKKIGNLVFESKDIYKKYIMLDKHIKLVAKCIDEGCITSDYFFSSFTRICVRNYSYDGRLKLYVLFSNSSKMLLFSLGKYGEVGNSFFSKFDFKNTNNEEVNIDNKGKESFRLRSKKTNLKPMFDFVGD